MRSVNLFATDEAIRRTFFYSNEPYTSYMGNIDVVENVTNLSDVISFEIGDKQRLSPKTGT